MEGEARGRWHIFRAILSTWQIDAVPSKLTLFLRWSHARPKVNGLLAKLCAVVN